jgi:hypothetical protein
MDTINSQEPGESTYGHGCQLGVTSVSIQIHGSLLSSEKKLDTVFLAEPEEFHAHVECDSSCQRH